MDNLLKILESRFFLLAIVTVLGSLLVRQHNLTNEAKDEVTREINNGLSLKDSIRIYKQQNEQILTEKSSLEVKNSQLTEKQKELIASLQLEKNRKVKPKTVIQYITVIKEVIKNVPSTIHKDNDGNQSILFTHKPILTGKNKLKIEGKVPYELSLEKDPNDSTKYLTSLKPGDVTLIFEQNIDIVTGIYQDPKTKRVMTRIKTEFPGLTFSEINSFDITDSPGAKNLIKSGRKPFGLGLSAGYGFFPGARKADWFIGVGLNYSPKFLQFGK